ncbi:MAG: hypothetical protein E7158_01480 [Firmicutes bacterium]|nr:hypothetical protein [Bacillota bacterium]
MNDIMNSVISLDNGEKYVMLDSTDYNGIKYYLANDVDDNHLGNDIAIFKAEMINGQLNLVMEPDIKICEELIKIFDSQAKK